MLDVISPARLLSVILTNHQMQTRAECRIPSAGKRRTAGLCAVTLLAWGIAQQQPLRAQDPPRATSARGSAPLILYGTNESAQSRWRLSARPLLTVGGANGSGPTEFATIVGVLRLDDGRLVVADAGSRELRYFDRAGRFVEKRAGPGRGPGEVQGLEGLYLQSDTLYALDSYGGAHLYSIDGAYLRTLPYRMGPASTFSGNPSGVVANSGLVGLGRLRNWQRRPAGVDSSEVRVLRAGERTPVTIATLPSGRTFQQTGDAYARWFAFSPSLVVASFPTEICTSFTETYEIVCLGTTGRPTRTLRRALRPRAVTDSMKRAWRDGMAGRLPGSKSRWEGSLRVHRENVARTSEFTRALPTIARLVASRTGELWVSDYQPSDGIVSFAGGVTRPPAEPTRWNIFDARSRWIGTLMLPPRFSLFDVGRDWVAGVARDEDDVERVEVWEVRRQ